MICFEDIENVLREKNPEAIPKVRKAFDLADYAHSGVFRESGEPYIIHPLHVAQNLLNMEVYDTDTLCAALLHDVVEDTDITLGDIEENLNKQTAELVDGVTKIRRMNFSTKQEQAEANSRKIINGLARDMRIILIKLADRLHNMQTLEYKIPKKQRENAIETMEIFVPFALSIGAYQIKSELEDLALMYIDPNYYKEIVEKREELGIKKKAYLAELKAKIEAVLREKNIPNDILIRTKNVCNIYRKMKQGFEMENIYDLFYLKILVEEVDDCYRTLRIVHSITPPINGRFKDYIFNPRTNHYQSLHTTVSDNNGRFMKTKIRTFDMDKISAFGLPAYWNIDPNKDPEEIPRRKTIEETQEIVRKELPLARKVQETDASFISDKDFMKEIKASALADHVYVYTPGGDSIELPVGSTALDFACEAFPELLDIMTGVIINEKECPVNTVLQNNDIVEVKTKGTVNRNNWVDCAHTSYAKHKLRVLNNRQNPEQAL